MQNKYIQAVENKKYRQEFLNSIDLEYTKHCVKNIIYYDNEGTFSIKPSIFAKLLFIKRTKSVINVHSSAFQEETINDFLNLLIDDYGFRAKLFYEKPNMLSYPRLKLGLALYAKNIDAIRKEVGFMYSINEFTDNIVLENKIIMAEKRKCSESYMKKLKKEKDRIILDYALKRNMFK